MMQGFGASTPLSRETSTTEGRRFLEQYLAALKDSGTHTFAHYHTSELPERIASTHGRQASAVKRRRFKTIRSL
jgi:hypothetical protein